MFVDLENPDTFVIIERYVNMEAFEKHKQTDHFKKAVELSSPLVAAPTKIHVLN